MELLLAIAIGSMTAAGVYLLLRLRTFPVVLGLSMLSYAVNVFIFASGRLVTGAPPILGAAEVMTDPLPQALILTAIVISFAVTSFFLVLAYRAYQELGTDNMELLRGTEDYE